MLVNVLLPLFGQTFLSRPPRRRRQRIEFDLSLCDANSQEWVLKFQRNVLFKRSIFFNLFLQECSYIRSLRNQILILQRSECPLCGFLTRKSNGAQTRVRCKYRAKIGAIGDIRTNNISIEGGTLFSLVRLQ